MADAAVGLQTAVRAALREVADPAKAAPMQAYMKSAMPYLGVPTPARRIVQRQVFTAHKLADRPTWEAAVRQLWDEAEFREERYVAITLTGERRYLSWQDPETVPLYEHLIVSGAWWDYVDELAIRRVGPIVRAYPLEMTSLLRSWAGDGDLWRRRTAVIAQVGSKAVTDTSLLADVIETNLDGSPITKNFFIRKGIGWALREYAKTDPDWVRAFVHDHADALAPLSVREATKHLKLVDSG